MSPMKTSLHGSISRQTRAPIVITLRLSKEESTGDASKQCNETGLRYRNGQVLMVSSADGVDCRGV